MNSDIIHAITLEIIDTINRSPNYDKQYFAEFKGIAVSRTRPQAHIHLWAEFRHRKEKKQICIDCTLLITDKPLEIYHYRTVGPVRGYADFSDFSQYTVNHNNDIIIAAYFVETSRNLPKLEDITVAQPTKWNGEQGIFHTIHDQDLITNFTNKIIDKITQRIQYHQSVLES